MDPFPFPTGGTSTLRARASQPTPAPPLPVVSFATQTLKLVTGLSGLDNGYGYGDSTYL